MINTSRRFCTSEVKRQFQSSGILGDVDFQMNTFNMCMCVAVACILLQIILTVSYGVTAMYICMSLHAAMESA